MCSVHIHLNHNATDVYSLACSTYLCFATVKYNRLNEEREEKERQKMVPGLDSHRIYIGQTLPENTMNVNYGSIDQMSESALNTSGGSDFNVDFT